MQTWGRLPLEPSADGPAVVTLDDIAQYYSRQLTPFDQDELSAAIKGALAAALRLVVPAGAQLTVAGQITEAANWAWSTIGGSAWTAIAGVLADLGARVWASVSGAIGWILKWAYAYLRGTVLQLVEAGDQSRFPAADSLFGTDPLWLLSLIGNLLIYALKGAVSALVKWAKDAVIAGLGYVAHGYPSVSDVIWNYVAKWVEWLRARLNEALGFAAHGYPSVSDVIYNYVGQWVEWLRARVRDALGFAARGFGNLVDFITSAVSAGGTWLWNTVSAGLGYAARGFGSLVDFVASAVSAGGTWLWSLIGPAIAAIPGLVATAVGTIPGLSGNLVDLVIAGVRTLINGLWALIQPAIAAIPGLVAAAIGTIPGLTANLVELVVGGVRLLIDGLWALIRPAIDAIPGAVAAAIGTIPGLTGTLVSLVLEGVDLLLRPLATAVNDAATWVWNNVRPLLEDIQRTLIAGAQDVFGGLLDLLKDGFRWIFDNAAAPISGFLNQKLQIVSDVVNMKYATMGEAVEALLDPPDQVMNSFFALVLLPIILGGMVASIAGGVGLVYARPIIQDYQAKFGGQLPPPNVLTQMARRGLISRTEMMDALRRQGFDEAYAAGYAALVEQIPGVSDIIRMGVREAFTPAIAEQFGQYQDLPPALVEWAGKQGLDEEWAARFWASHWELPSVQQGMEMYHRGLIDGDTLQLLLRAADVMPFWRDKLTGIAFNPLNRVDVRRMYQAGVIDIGKVESTYRAQGYSADDAAALARWVAQKYPPGGTGEAVGLRDLTVATVKQAYARRLVSREEAMDRLAELDYGGDEADLLLSIWDFDFFTDPDQRSDITPKALGRAVIEQAYARGLLDQNRAAAQLEDAGYTPEDAALLLTLVDLKNNEDQADLEVDVVVQQYRSGIITLAQMAGALRDLHVPEARIELLAAREGLRRQVKTAELTVAQLTSAWKKDIVSEQYFRARLDARGYNDEDIDILVELNRRS